MKTLKTCAALACLVSLTGAAQAALVDRGGGMIYDTSRNITWLADMNFAKTSGHDSDGLMDWAAAMRWADSLVHGGYDDWRLPTLEPSDASCSNSFDPGGGWPVEYFGFNCTGGELSGLFVTDLGNKGRESVLNPAGDTVEQIANLALFSNVGPNTYWSGTGRPRFASDAMYFAADLGLQVGGNRGEEKHALAVRSGDVVAQVPEPQALALALLAVCAMAIVRRGRPRRR